MARPNRVNSKPASTGSTTGSNDRLNPKQDRFCREYLVDHNATQAAIRAGYSPRCAGVQAAQLLVKPKIQDRVAELTRAQSTRLEITADRVISEIAKVAFADMADYVTIQPDGTPVLDFGKAPDGGLAAVSQIEQETVTERGGGDVERVKRTKFRLHPKLDALDKLARHLGLYKDSVELNGNLTIHAIDARQELLGRLDRAVRRGSSQPADQRDDARAGGGAPLGLGDVGPT